VNRRSVQDAWESAQSCTKRRYYVFQHEIMLNEGMNIEGMALLRYARGEGDVSYVGTE